MEQEVLNELIVENRKLEANLTKRNEQYIYDLNKALTAANLSEELKELAIHTILTELVAGQKTGKTARQLFGTVTERAQIIIANPEPPKETTMGQMWVDNSLFMLALLAAMSGLFTLLSKGKTEPQGILTLLLASISGGYSFYLMYKYIYRFDRPGVDQTDRPKAVKATFIMVGAFMLWFVIFVGSSALPRSINIQLDPIVNLLLALAAYGVRYIYRKQYKITGNMFAR